MIWAVYRKYSTQAVTQRHTARNRARNKNEMRSFWWAARNKVLDYSVSYLVLSHLKIVYLCINTDTHSTQQRWTAECTEAPSTHSKTFTQQIIYEAINNINIRTRRKTNTTVRHISARWCTSLHFMCSQLLRYTRCELYSWKRYRKRHTNRLI